MMCISLTDVEILVTIDKNVVAVVEGRFFGLIELLQFSVLVFGRLTAGIGNDLVPAVQNRYKTGIANIILPPLVYGTSKRPSRYWNRPKRVGRQKLPVIRPF